MTKKQCGASLTNELDVTPLPDCLEGQRVGTWKKGGGHFQKSPPKVAYRFGWSMILELTS